MPDEPNRDLVSLRLHLRPPTLVEGLVIIAVLAQVARMM